MLRRNFLASGVVALVVVGGMLAGCAGPAGPSQPVTVAPSEALTFRLSSVEVIDETAGTAVDSALASSFTVTPQQAIQRWAAERLSASGGSPGTLRVRITEASAQRQGLEKTPGVQGWFRRDQEELVSVVFAAQLEARRNDGTLIASVTGRSEANQSFVEKIKPAERRAGLDNLVRRALASFDREIEARARAEMPDLLL